MECVVVKTSDGQYTVMRLSTVAGDMELSRVSGQAPGYHVVAMGLDCTWAWHVAAVLEGLRTGGVAVIGADMMNEMVKLRGRERVWWTLNACIAISKQAELEELAEIFEVVRDLLKGGSIDEQE